MFEVENDNATNVNIYNDIFNFLELFVKKYKYNINFKLLLQADDDIKNNYEEITKRILNELYNIDDKYLNNNNESINEQNGNNEKKEDIINNDLEINWW